MAGMLNKDKGLNDLLQTILVELTKLLPSDIAAIWLLNETYDPETSKLSSELEVAAVIGCCEDALGRLNTLNVDKEKWFHQAIESATPIIRQSGEEAGPLGEAMGYQVGLLIHRHGSNCQRKTAGRHCAGPGITQPLRG